MSCKMKIEQLKEAVAGGNDEVKSGESVWLFYSQFNVRKVSNVTAPRTAPQLVG